MAKAHPAGRRDEAGNRLCRWCSKPVRPPRLNWCGQECVRDYKIQSNQADARRACWQRDRGVCALCGVDTEDLKGLWWEARGDVLPLRPDEVRAATTKSGPMFVRSPYWRSRVTDPRSALEIRAAMLGFPPARHAAWWEADHAVPLCEGGSPALDNLRTLCVPCHRRETRALARRRAGSVRATPHRFQRYCQHYEVGVCSACQDLLWLSDWVRCSRCRYVKRRSAATTRPCVAVVR